MTRSMFAADGTLLLAADKASVMQAIEVQPSQPMQLSQPLHLGPVLHPAESTYIIDAMAVLQATKKTSRMKKIIHLKQTFINTIIKRHTHKGGYNDVRVLFDQYLPLKEKTRTKSYI